MKKIHIVPGQNINLTANPKITTPEQAISKAIHFCRENGVKDMFLQYGGFSFGIDPDSQVNDLLQDYLYWQKIPIKELDISVRCHNLLMQNKIEYLNDLCKFNRKHLLQYMNFGAKSLQEIDQLMEKYDLKFMDT